MESMATDVAKTCVEKLIDGAVAESRYVCCFTSIADKFKTQKARLEAERRTVEQRVNVARERGNDILYSVGEWEKQADELIQEDTKTEKKCFFGFCPDCIWRYKMGKKLEDKTENMKQLVEEKFESIEIPCRLPDVEFHSSQNYIHFKGRESEYKELLEALKDENNFITGLHGMGGSGKTTLAKNVGKELKQSKTFNYVIDTTVSHTPNIKKIQDDIAGPLGLKLENCNESDRPKKLWRRLTNGEKILLILDDVWDQKPPLDFDAIGIPKQDNHKNCRVLVTTRDKRVLNKMSCDETIKLKVLSEEDSRIMFKSYAGITSSSPKSLIDKGHKIADECKRLPVAIAAVASSLKGQKSPEEWDFALKSLQDPLSSIQGDDESLVEICNCLKFSYDYLKDENAKRLFLLCSTFPEDEEIHLEILTRLGIGVGLFGEDYGSYNDARNQVVVAKNKLLDSNLLLEAGKGHVKMHDLVREVAQLIANQEIRTVNLSHKDPKSLVEMEKNTKYLFCQGKAREMFSSSFGGSKLEILIASLDGVKRDCVEVPNSFSENMVGLRALHLYSKMWFPYQLSISLPPWIQSLTNIRSLVVCKVNLGNISVLGNLHCLETFDLAWSTIDELPHEITKLLKFKLLSLKSCQIERNNPFEVIGRCISLEELYFQDSFNIFCREISLPTLQRYVITKTGDYESYERIYAPSDFEPDGSLSKFVDLFEDADVDIFSEATLKYFIQTTEVLALESIKWRWRNLIPETVPVDQCMNNLVKLYLNNISKLQELCNGPLSSDSLKNLEELSIIGCVNLRSLFNCNLDLCNLKTVTLRECPLLVSLFQLSTAKSLMMLEKLEIYDCGQLESIITDEKRGGESKEEIVVDADNNSNKKGSSMFAKLKALDIHGCPRLKFILPFFSGHLPVLETISIAYCDDLKYIFDQFVKFGSLKKMKLSKLPNFIDIFPTSYHPVPLLVKGSPSTSRDDFKAQTGLDLIKCNVFSWIHKLRSTTSSKVPLVSEDQCPISSESNSDGRHIWEHAQCFSRLSQTLFNITMIDLSNVSKIKFVFFLSTSRRMLLETLIISDCDELKHIVVDIEDDSEGNNTSHVFPKLKKLYVKGCRKLEYICGHYAHDHQSHEIHLQLPKLTHLQLHDCTQLGSKSIGDFIGHAISRSLDSTTMKELNGNVEHFLALKELHVAESNVENVFSLDETSGQQLTLMLQNIKLQYLAVMTYLFKGPKSSVTLQNLTSIEIRKCEKLEIIFSTTVVRCLPQLLHLRIEYCKELKYIIEDDAKDDVEDEIMSNFLPPRTCFPKLKTVVVLNCNKLKCVFPVSTCKGLHELRLLLIGEADELHEIFKSKDGQKFEIPNLNVIAFLNLPSLYQAQAIHFQDVENRIVKNCQKLSLTSVSTPRVFYEIHDHRFGYELYDYLCTLFTQLKKDSKARGTSNENPSAKTSKYLAGFEVHAPMGHELTSSQEFLTEPSPNQQCLMSQQLSLGENDATIKPSQGNNCLEETKDHSIQEASTSEIAITTVLSTNSETRSQPPTQSVSPNSKQESFKTSVEEGTILDNAKTVKSSTHLEPIGSSLGPLLTSEHKTSSHEDGDGKAPIHSLLTTKTKHQMVKDENLSVEMNKDFTAGVEVQATLRYELTYPRELLNEPSTSQQYLMSQQHPHGEIDTTVKPSQGTKSLEEIKDQSIQEEASTSEKDITTVLPISSKTRSKPPTQFVSPKSKQESFKTSVEEGTTVDNVKAITSSTHFKSMSSSSGPLVTFEHKTFSQSLSTPNEGNPSQIMESLSSSSLITWELQQLVSKKHLASENLSLLTDFLVKNPFVRLRDNSQSNRYKGYAYNCLAELLKFLQTHSVLDVLESSRSEFVELLQDARRCAFSFDKGWLDGIEKRALFPDLPFSQDALEKLLHSKQQVTKDIEMLHLKIGIFSQHLEDLKNQLTSSEADLETIIQQELQVLESRVALSLPLGY